MAKCNEQLKIDTNSNNPESICDLQSQLMTLPIRLNIRINMFNNIFAYKL